MLHPAQKIGLFVVVLGLLFVPNAMWGQKDAARLVKDEAKLFGEKAREDANAIIAQIKKATGKDLFIETVEKGPTSGAAKWAEERARTAGVDGVYIVIANEPKLFEIVVGKGLLEDKYFTLAQRDEVRKLLLKHLKENRDEALVKVSEYARKALNDVPAHLKPRLIQDEAKMFGDGAIKSANAVVAQIKQKHRKDLMIETRVKGLDDAKALADWAKERAGTLKVDGIYVVITTEPKRYQVFVTKETREKGLFIKADLDALVETLRGLRDDHDGTLQKATDGVLKAMDSHQKK